MDEAKDVYPKLGERAAAAAYDRPKRSMQWCNSQAAIDAAVLCQFNHNSGHPCRTEPQAPDATASLWCRPPAVHRGKLPHVWDVCYPLWDVCYPLLNQLLSPLLAAAATAAPVTAAAAAASHTGILANFGLIAAGWFIRFVNFTLAKDNEVLALQVRHIIHGNHCRDCQAVSVCMHEACTMSTAKNSLQRGHATTLLATQSFGQSLCYAYASGLMFSLC